MANLSQKKIYPNVPVSVNVESVEQANNAIENIKRHLDSLATYADFSDTLFKSTFLVEGDDIDSMSVSKLRAGIIAVDQIYLGSTNFAIDGILKRITIKDEQATPVTRLEFGSFGTGTDYGMKVRDASGNTILDLTGLGSNTVGALQVVNGAISNVKISDLAATKITGQIVDAQILSVAFAKINNVLVTNAQIANLAVTQAKIANLAVGTAQIIDGSIATAKIASAAIVNAKIGNLEVDNAKINNLTIGTSKHQANAITDYRTSTQGTTNLSAGSYVTVATITSFATGGYDAFLMYTGNLNNSNGALIRVVGASTVIHSGQCPDGQNVSIVLVDTGSTGTHTYTVQFNENSSGSAQMQNNKFSGFLLKT